MFGNNNNKEPDAQPPAAEEFRMPPLGTITVTTADDTEHAWEGHQIEQTTFGAINIHRLYQVSAERILQKMVVSYAPGNWKKVTQKLDIIEFTPPSTIIH